MFPPQRELPVWTDFARIASGFACTLRPIFRSGNPDPMADGPKRLSGCKSKEPFAPLSLRSARLSLNSAPLFAEAGMEAQRTTTSAVVTRLIIVAKNFAQSEVGGRAKLMFAAILTLLFAVNGLNVVNSYVNRNLMSAIAERRLDQFVSQAQLTLVVFAASTIVAVLARFGEERLGLLWREFMTERAFGVYMANGTYYRLATSGELANPDQRIAEDVRAFTATTLSFLLMAMNSVLTVLAFSGVLWSISPELFIISVVYAALGSYLTIRLDRPLIRLNGGRGAGVRGPTVASARSRSPPPQPSSPTLLRTGEGGAAPCLVIASEANQSRGTSGARCSLDRRVPPG
jgi:ABC transporter transmembrane region 2